MATITAREFNRDVSAAKRQADREPVIVTDRGEPAYVLLTIDDYRRLEGSSSSEFLRTLRMDEGIEADFPPVHLDLRVPEF